MSDQKTTLSARQSDGLTERAEDSAELVLGKGASAEQAAIQSAIVVAKRFPRDEMGAITKLARSCQRPAFAEDAMYSFPRGGDEIHGPSVKLAREAARCWGNMVSGLEVVSDTEESRHIKGWAWDLETNTRVFAEDTFAKRVFRKSKDGKGGYWKDVGEDERELRELTNRRGAICVRNSILQLIPYDVVETAIAQVFKTLNDEAAQDPDAARKAAALSMAEVGVSPEELTEYLGKPIAQASPQDVARLRAMATSIRDGNSTWGDYVAAKDGGTPMPRATAPAPAQQPAPATQAKTQDGQAGAQESSEGQRAPRPTNGGGGRTINEKQARLLMARGRNQGLSEDQVKAKVSEKFGCEVMEMTNGQLNEVLQELG